MHIYKKRHKMRVNEDLLKRLKAGEEKAFEDLYWTYSPQVYNFINSLLFDKSLAEDLTQNVFLKIWEKHEQIELELGITAYLFTIARHLVFKETEFRLSQHATLHVENIDLSDNSKEEQQHEVNSLLEYIDHLIENLPPARREIFRLSRLEQLSNKEIAHKLSISEKTVETQLYRSFQYLRSKLPPDRRWILLFCYFVNQC